MDNYLFGYVICLVLGFIIVVGVGMGTNLTGYIISLVIYSAIAAVGYAVLPAAASTYSQF